MKLRKSRNKRIIKAATRFKPFDFEFLLDIEREALIRMRDYFERSDISVEDMRVAKELKLAIKLLDIALGKDRTGFDIMNVPRGYSTKYINTSNYKRFIYSKNKVDFSSAITRDLLRETKAWIIYNKLKMYRMLTWWD